MEQKVRQATVTWIVVYPMITGLNALLEPIVVHWPMPLRTLLLSVIMVPLMVVWAMPFATTRL